MRNLGLSISAAHTPKSDGLSLTQAFIRIKKLMLLHPQKAKVTQLVILKSRVSYGNPGRGRGKKAPVQSLRKKEMQSRDVCQLKSQLLGIIYNSQDMEATWMSIDRGMGKEDVVPTYNGILLGHKKE